MCHVQISVIALMNIQQVPHLYHAVSETRNLFDVQDQTMYS